MARSTTVRQPRRVRNEKGGKFRVLVGSHFGNCPAGCNCEGGPSNHRYDVGDVVESAQDLEARCNAGPYSRKFERVAIETPLFSGVADSGDDYDSMTVPQLRAAAEAMEVDLGTAKTKDEIIRILRG